MIDAIEVAKATIEKYSEEINKLYPTFKLKKVILLNNKKSINRLFVVYEFNGKNKTKSYPRLLLEIKLSRILTDDETCDHIDFDSLNNDFQNLQVLSRSENAKRGPSLNVKERIRKAESLRRTGISAEYNLGSKNGLSKLIETQVKEIKEYQKIHTFKRGQDSFLAKKYNVTRGTIKGIRLEYVWKQVVI